MRLAELLNERKALKVEIRKMKERLNLAARMQEGDEKPVESPGELKSSLMELYEKLEDLVVKINRANTETWIEEKSLMELIAERDRNTAIAEMLHSLAEGATPKPERFSRNEIRYVPAIDIRSIRKEADSYSKAAREIDSMIQSANWSTGVG